MSNYKETEVDASLGTTGPVIGVRTNPEATVVGNKVPENGALEIMLQGVRERAIPGKRVLERTTKNTRVPDILMVPMRSGPRVKKGFHTSHSM